MTPSVLPKNKEIRTVKFMQTINESQWNKLLILAEDKGITVQEYLRIFVINEFLRYSGAKEAFRSVKYSKRALKSWETRRKNAEAEEINTKKMAFPQ